MNSGPLGSVIPFFISGVYERHLLQTHIRLCRTLNSKGASYSLNYLAQLYRAVSTSPHLARIGIQLSLSQLC